jgi:hypothetical protein
MRRQGRNSHHRGTPTGDLTDRNCNTTESGNLALMIMKVELI